MFALITSNDVGRFWNYLADSNSNFVVVDFISKTKQSDFLCVRGSITYNVTVHLHVLWPVFARALISCRHTANRHTHTQRTYTVQTQPHFHSNRGCVFDDS